MYKFAGLVIAWFSVFGWSVAQDLDSFSTSIPELQEEQPVFTREILPEDIVQESIRLVRFSEDRFAVRWSYTVEGAEKFIEFREAHDGKMVRLKIGEFVSPSHNLRFHPTQLSATFKEWKEGWLKHRGDKIFGVSEEVANQIVAGLKSEPEQDVPRN